MDNIIDHAQLFGNCTTRLLDKVLNNLFNVSSKLQNNHDIYLYVYIYIHTALAHPNVSCKFFSTDN